jgi:hypothetical protein
MHAVRAYAQQRSRRSFDQKNGWLAVRRIHREEFIAPSVDDAAFVQAR